MPRTNVHHHSGAYGRATGTRTHSPEPAFSARSEDNEQLWQSLCLTMWMDQVELRQQLREQQSALQDVQHMQELFWLQQERRSSHERSAAEANAQNLHDMMEATQWIAWASSCQVHALAAVHNNAMQTMTRNNAVHASNQTGSHPGGSDSPPGNHTDKNRLKKLQKERSARKKNMPTRAEQRVPLQFLHRMVHRSRCCSI